MAEEGYKERGFFGSDKPGKEEADEEKGNGGFFSKVKHFVKDTIGFGKPTADVSGFHILHISLEKVDIVVDVLVTNPNPIPIPLVDIIYLIESDGRKLISGTIPDAGTVHAHGSETIKIPICLIYKDIKDTYDDIQPGEIIPYRVSVELLIDVPIIGRISLPLEKKGEIPVPYKPDVDLDKIEFDRLSLEETTASLHLKVENKNKFDLGVNTLEYSFTLGDDNIANATLSESTKIGQCGEGILEVPITFRPKDLGSAVWDIVRGRGAGYSMKGKLEVDTPFGPMNIPFSKEGGKATFQKKGKDRGLDESDFQDEE
ncbi:hypothetical protein KP509_26G027600 [Ceratopteris richardii]|uniref:Water stress and hypersensitive response domain-containing protein n=1 Tax=Ceratopteris richardii TaxID=49495 RepID=A0A8T2RJ72_CERRI|nr:hypothetical protein KP509_26G027600 [Ceratopteris richardii]